MQEAVNTGVHQSCPVFGVFLGGGGGDETVVRRHGASERVSLFEARRRFGPQLSCPWDRKNGKQAVGVVGVASSHGPR